MSDPLAFYKSEKLQYEFKLAVVKKQLLRLSLFRFLVFLFAVSVVYFYFGNIQVVIGTLVLAIALFLFLVSRYTDLQYKRDELQELVKINQTEINVLKGDVSELNAGKEFSDPGHFFSNDIDLFGKGSFFQYSNRTTTKAGKKKLASILTANHIDQIVAKQKGIQELADKPQWRQQFSAIATLVKTEVSPVFIIKWLNNHQMFLPKAMAFLPMVFSLVSLAIMVSMYFGVLSFSHLLIWFVVGFMVTGSYVKKINELYRNSGKVKDTFQQYYKLLEIVENTEFISEVLKEQHDLIQTEKKKASLIFKELSKALESLDQRNNIIVGVLGNGLLLWDIRHSYRIEQWIKTYSKKAETWFDVISFFDAQNSMGNFVFNHPSYVFPEIKESNCVVKSSQLGHPLLKEDKRVCNDCTIEKQDFFIVTGANMAGKSTFLRTVSLNIMMANIGLPVCAKAFEYSPIKLITSMRTTDSLTDDASYFFSELKRLKFIVEEIKNEQYFIVLDEILKGTNSHDKAIGSQKFVEKLVDSNSTGIIATHDLSLCKLENDLSQIKNYYFDAEIINDELYFDYQFKTGICKNMNASFLLKKMEIV